MARRIRMHDWAATPLGPTEGWASSLRTAVDIVLAMPGPATILWGPQNIQIYNDAYVSIARSRHPALLGRPVAEGWPDAYETVIAPLIHSARAGRATRLTRFAVALRRPDGQLEERVFDTDWSPLRDETGEVAGALQTLIDATDRHHAETALREGQARQAFLLRLTDTLRAELDADTIVDRAVHMLAEELVLDRCYATAMYPDENRVDVTHEFRRPNLNPMPARLRFSDFPEAGRQSFDRTLVFNDTANDPELTNADKQALAAMSFGAFLSRPLRSGAGNPIWALGAVSSRPRPWTHGEIVLIEEVTERTWAAAERARAEAALRESEERNAFLVRFSDAVRGLADPALVARETCRILTEQLGTDRTLWAVLDWERREYVADWAFLANGTPVEPSRWPFDEREPFAREHLAGRPVVYDDVAVNPLIPDPVKAAMTERGLLAGIAVPVVVAGKLVAVLNTSQCRAPRRWRAEEIAFVKVLAQRAWGEIERARAEAALQESEELRRIALESGGMGAWQWDTRSRSVRADEPFQRLWGVSFGDRPHPVSVYTERMSQEGAAALDAVMAREPVQGEVLQDQVEVIHGPTAGRWVQWRGRADRDRPWIINGVSFDITVQRSAEQRLRESEARFRSLVMAGTYLMYRMSPDWRQMYELSGQSLLADTVEPAEDWADVYLLPEDRPVIFAAIKEAIRTKSLFELEHRVRLADGGVGWVLSRAVPILGADGEIVEWFGAGNDVTARNEAQQRLRQVEERHRIDLEQQVRERTTELHANRDLLQATMDASTDMIQVFAAVRDKEGKIVDFRWVLNNHTSESHYGKVHGESLLQRNPGVVVEGIFDAFKRVTETGVPEQAERHYAHEQFNGWFYQSVVKLGDGVATTTKDITEWKAAQEELLRLQAQVAQARIDESEERFRGLVQGMAQAVWETDADGLVVADSPSWRAYTGQTLDEWLGYGWLDAIHPDDRAFAERQWHTAVAAARTVDAEFRLRHAGGGWRWTNVRSVPLKAGDGSIRRWSGINLDISERKAVEEALRRREEELRVITDNVPAMIGFYDREFRYRVVNEEFARFFKKPKEEILGRTVAEVAGERIFANLKPWMERALAGEQVRFEDEGWRAADPTLWGWTEENYVPHRNEAGEVDGFHALVFDITDRKRHERALRESEARFRLLVKSVRDYAIFTTDRDGIITSWPAGAAAVYGWSEAEILGRSVELTFVPEDVANGQPQKERETAIREGLAPNVREHLRKDGTRIFINGSTQPLIDVDGQTREFIKIGQDVTEPRRMQEALAESEKRLRTLTEGMPQLVWRSADGGRWTWSSPQWQAFTGQSLEASLGFGWLEAVHVDDREIATAAWRQAVLTDLIGVEYRIRRASDGAYLWHHTRSVPVRDGSDHIVEWLGTTTDVQQLKELQERQDVLVAELQHRTRNLLGVVRALFQETMKRSGSLSSFNEQFGERLNALARVNAMLSRSGQPRITIGELVRTTLDALGGSAMGERIRFDGPEVRLRSSIVQTLALALHELATNARKYGALAAEQGRLEVTWSTQQSDGEGQRLVVEWVEHGRAPIQVKAETSRRGYGRELIERALPYALKARTHYELGEDGVRCSLDLPLTRAPRRERTSS
ncbi:PAS domain S-box protein [Methylobacterium sp. 17Sr1-1]|uniref:PAS domain S-box protein n=1 Tax=Methylobacterium sp. 17Sr1-1 TaxID=2202826 RepID=UPI000D6FF1BB|nr:PAS domain S-box protein [Methylobacterium sp. 17Sr1-1]AWN52157.1 hypothetical protein DK412_11135 [Methylobacterium sp. 17Sr1-1]